MIDSSQFGMTFTLRVMFMHTYSYQYFLHTLNRRSTNNNMIKKKTHKTVYISNIRHSHIYIMWYYVILVNHICIIYMIIIIVMMWCMMMTNRNTWHFFTSSCLYVPIINIGRRTTKYIKNCLFSRLYIYLKFVIN